MKITKKLFIFIIIIHFKNYRRTDVEIVDKHTKHKKSKKHKEKHDLIKPTPLVAETKQDGKPATPKPDSSKPATPKPDTSKPATPKPDLSKPATPKPETPKPATPKPDSSKAATPRSQTPVIVHVENDLTKLREDIISTIQ